jgi:nucleoid-associated protein YgaU
MTRETKIGLLVGLAFIIVIGILLSDHMTSTNEPPLAPLQLAGNNARSALGQPATDNAPPVVVTPPNVSPVQTVMTRDELTPRRAVQPQQSPVTLSGQDAVASNQGNTSRSSNVPAALADAARRNGEELVDGAGQPLAIGDATQQQATAPQPAKTATAGTYKAEAGDSLTKIATKVYGTSTKALRDGIINANPSLKDNPNKIVVGKTYVIPPQNGTAPTNTTAVLPTPAPTTPTAAKTDDKPAAVEHVYVVQQGDTLWSIARDEVGNAGAVAAIRELNQDVLKGSDRVRPNMKLKLPAKAVASAN